MYNSNDDHFPHHTATWDTFCMSGLFNHFPSFFLLRENWRCVESGTACREIVSPNLVSFTAPKILEHWVSVTIRITNTAHCHAS